MGSKSFHKKPDVFNTMQNRIRATMYFRGIILSPRFAICQGIHTGKRPRAPRGSGGCGFFARRNGECFVQNAVVGPYLGVLRAGVDGVLEDLCAAVGVEGPTYAPDQLLRLAREHRACDNDEGPGSLGRIFYRGIEDLRHSAYSTLRVAVNRVYFVSAGSVWACGVPSCALRRRLPILRGPRDPRSPETGRRTRAPGVPGTSRGTSEGRCREPWPL